MNMMASEPSATIVEHAKKVQKENAELRKLVTTLGNLTKRYQGMFGRVLTMVPKEKVAELEKMMKAVHTSNGPTLEIKAAPPPPQPKPGEKKKEDESSGEPPAEETSKEAEGNAALANEEIEG